MYLLFGTRSHDVVSLNHLNSAGLLAPSPCLHVHKGLGVRENSFSKSELALLNLDFISWETMTPNPTSLLHSSSTTLSLCHTVLPLLLLVWLDFYASWLLSGEEKIKKMGLDCRRLVSGEKLEVTTKGITLRAEESTQLQGLKDTCQSSWLSLCNFSLCWVLCSLLHVIWLSMHWFISGVSLVTLWVPLKLGSGAIYRYIPRGSYCAWHMIDTWGPFVEPIHLPSHLLIIHLSSTYPSLHLPDGPPTNCPSTHPHIYSFTHPATYPSIYMSTCPFIQSAFQYLSIHPSTYPLRDLWFCFCFFLIV